MRDAAISSDGIPIRYEVHGTGAPALVFVHGWSCDRSYWSGQLGHFARRHQVLAVDLAGHGESGVGRQVWTMPAFGDDVVAVADRLELDHMVLIGHSMGGDVIVEAALRLSDRMVGLVWVDVYSTLGTPRTSVEIEQLASPLRADFAEGTQRLVRRMFRPDADPELVDRVADDMASAPPAIALDALLHAVANDGPILDALARVAATVVAINPDHRPTDIGALRRHGVEAVVMSGVGHFLMLEDPARFNRLLEDAIQSFQWP